MNELTLVEVRDLRLRNQQIADSSLVTPAEVVSYMGAMQAQEYAHAKWAIGLRAPGLYDADVEAAVSEGAILRTHILRPTWHFVAPADIRWMLKLVAPHVLRRNASVVRNVGTTPDEQAQAMRIFEKALTGTQLTRTQLREALAENGIEARGQRLAYLVMHAELEGLICSGARQGKQFTYALIDEVAPLAANDPSLDASRDEMLHMLASRYIVSRGPASVHDFSTWSGLSVADARQAFLLCSNEVEQVLVEGKPYYVAASLNTYSNAHPKHSPDLAATESVSLENSTFLMPDYDEYGMGYKDRSALAGLHSKELAIANVYSHWLVVNGTIEGAWTINKGAKDPLVSTDPFANFSKDEGKAVSQAERRYTKFVQD